MAHYYYFGKEPIAVTEGKRPCAFVRLMERWILGMRWISEEEVSELAKQHKL